jgi:hypothetical protein
MFLYLFYLGGNTGKSNIEVHDVQFVVASTPEDAWPALREAWFGDADKIHIDGYARITWADGYAVTLSTTPPEHDERLFFVNVGAYHPDILPELHAFDLFVARDAAEAKAKALAHLLTGANQQHKDNLKDVDDCLLLDKIGPYYLHLQPDPQGTAFKPEWQGYLPIGE